MSLGDYRHGEIVALLAPTLGEERAGEVVRDALTALRVTGDAIARRDVARTLEHIGRTPGFVGSVARFALARVMVKDAVMVKEAGEARRTVPPPGPRPVKDEILGRSELTALLASSLGEEKAKEVVEEALRKLGALHDTFPLSQGVAALDELARSEGLVGVTARFAKARLLLRASKP
jgi:hypothetical protein